MANSLTIRPGTGVAAFCWTFIFRGGPVFALQLESMLGPGHQHNGLLSVWKFVGTEDEAAEAEQTLKETFEGLRVERYTEVEDPEAEKERQRRFFGGDPDSGD